MGMVQTGEDAGFVQVCLDILGLRDSLGAGNFDRNPAVEVLIMGQEDLTEAALAQASEDRVTTDLRAIAVRGATPTHNGRLCDLDSRRGLRLIHFPLLDNDRSLS